MDKIDRLTPLTPEWFDEAFNGVDVPKFAKKAAKRICIAYGIVGQADPGYIANVIDDEFNSKKK